MIIARSAPHPTLSPAGRGHKVFPRPFGERNKVRSDVLHSKGFSLIEIIITLVVLSIAAVGVLSVFASGMRGSADPLLVNQATNLAREKMDEVIGDRRNAARGYAYIIPANYPAETPVGGFSFFDRSVAVFCVTAADLNTSTGAPPCGSGYTHVTVTVTNSVTGNVTAETVVANY